MITLITGTPGAGKTLYTVAEELPRFAGRTLYVDGIPGLTVDHELFTAPLEEWPKWAPDGAVIVVDEVQRIWRPRSAASKIPDSVAALETHRHRGLDFVLITQHPNLLDANVRRLIGRHIHIRRMFGWPRAVVYEWDSCSDPARVSTAIKRSWGYPKKAFSSYHSAVVHNARGQRLPLALVLCLIAGLILPIAGYSAYSRTQDKINAPIQVKDNPPGQVEAKIQAPSSDIPIPDVIPVSENVSMVSNKYDWSKVSSCLATVSKCHCYGYNAERLMIPDAVCRSAIVYSWAGRDTSVDPSKVIPVPI